MVGEPDRGAAGNRKLGDPKGTSGQTRRLTEQYLNNAPRGIISVSLVSCSTIFHLLPTARHPLEKTPKNRNLAHDAQDKPTDSRRLTRRKG